MEDCVLWCDGVWTWQEYAFVFIPIVCVIVFSFMATWIEEGNIVIVSIAGLIFGLIVNIVVLFVPYIFIFLIVFWGCVLIGWLLGELVKKVERKNAKVS